jgi:hypothetical protein
MRGILSWKHLLFALILSAGILARVWDFGALPPGLRLDEASSGVDAYDLLRFGLDRNGVSFPVHFISWGSGQNALYAYLMIPFLALGGLNPFTVRLPMLITGVLTMPLVYFVAKRTWSQSAGLIAMFLLAISPWHIVLSRWGLESNLLPFVFLVGYSCLLKSGPDNRWFVSAGLFLGLCLYAYGTAYAAVPIFLACAGPILLLTQRLRFKTLLAGLLVFLIVGLPIGVFLAVNSLRLQTVQVGPVAMPRLPTQPRYETMAAIFGDAPLRAMGQNLWNTLKLLWRQSDGLVWNTVEQVGYFYGRFAYGRIRSAMLVAPLTFAGALMTLPLRKTERLAERLLLLSWLAASLAIGILQPVNVNRINLIFIPLLLFLTAFLDWLGRRLKVALALCVCALLVGFGAFNIDYHGDIYRQQAAQTFEAGILPALDVARRAGDGPICVSGGGGERYIFALFSDPINPSAYLQTVRYYDAGPYGEVKSYGRYTFGMHECPLDPKTIYVLWGETPPLKGITYQRQCFDLYCVYLP